MDEYSVTTAHNVTLRFPHATLGDRVLAHLLDFFIKVGYVIALALFLYLMRNEGILRRDTLCFFIMFPPVLFYSLLFEYFMQGQTPGKRVLKIKVAGQDSEELTFGKCLLRWLFRSVDFWMFSGIISFVTVAATNKKQRIGDLIAGTIVASLKANKTLDDTIYAHIAQGHTVRYPQVARLSTHDIEIIKAVINQYEQEGKYDLVPAAAARVRQAIDADAAQDDLGFLRTVIADYYAVGA